MKPSLAFPSLLLALFITSTISAALPPSGSTWSITNMNFNPSLDYGYEGCWPNGAITLSHNASGSILTSSEWSGSACEAYDLTGGESFYIANGDQYGYINSNDSVKFNYNLINSSAMALNLWFGCDGESYCDTLADVVLSLEDPNPCVLYNGSYYYNICSSDMIYLSAYGALTISINGNTSSCDGTQSVWATWTDLSGQCYDVAAQKPTYNMIDPNDQSYGTLKMTFPAQQSPNSTRSFQFGLNLTCGYGPLSTSMQTDTSGLITFSVTGDSTYACAQPIGCPSVTLGSNSYNFCPFQQSNLTFNVSDLAFGQLAFSLGNTPLIPGCYGVSRKVFATYTAFNGMCYEIAWIPLTYYFPGSGSGSNSLSVKFERQQILVDNDLYAFDASITLQCDPNQENVAQFDPVMSFQSNFTEQQDVWGVANLQGTSPYACPLNSASIIA